MGDDCRPQRHRQLRPRQHSRRAARQVGHVPLHRRHQHLPADQQHLVDLGPLQPGDVLFSTARRAIPHALCRRAAEHPSSAVRAHGCRSPRHSTTASSAPPLRSILARSAARPAVALGGVRGRAQARPASRPAPGPRRRLRAACRHRPPGCGNTRRTVLAAPASAATRRTSRRPGRRSAPSSRVLPADHSSPERAPPPSAPPADRPRPSRPPRPASRVAARCVVVEVGRHRHDRVPPPPRWAGSAPRGVGVAPQPSQDLPRQASTRLQPAGVGAEVDEYVIAPQSQPSPATTAIARPRGRYSTAGR